jgi:hypothetical protein
LLLCHFVPLVKRNVNAGDERRMEGESLPVRSSVREIRVVMAMQGRREIVAICVLELLHRLLRIPTR